MCWSPTAPTPMKGIETWRHALGEKADGWIRRKNNKPVPNADLWKVLDELLVEKHTVECKWVKGHSGNPDNERCDVLATLHASGRPTD